MRVAHDGHAYHPDGSRWETPASLTTTKEQAMTEQEHTIQDELREMATRYLTDDARARFLMDRAADVIDNLEVRIARLEKNA